MNRIYMGKYGFVRESSRDFSDDGNYFEMWKTADGSMYVSKCVNQGFVYICGRADMIPNSGGYRIYSRVEGYKNLDDLNGVSISYLTDEKLQALHDGCIKFAKDLKAALAQVVIPTDEEILAKMRELNEP